MSAAVVKRAREWSMPEELLSAERSWELDAGLLLLARELVSLLPELGDGERRALLFLVTAALVNQRQGSTRLPLADGTLERLLHDLGATDVDRREVRRLLGGHGGGAGASSAILGGPAEFKPLLLDGEYLYIQRMHRAEQELLASLELRMGRPGGAGDPAAIDAALAQVLAAAPAPKGRRIVLSEEQQEAVRKALRLPLTVISGGPGTGKTSIVVSILRSLIRLDIGPERIALAAPTGKAANRMAESIRSYLLALPDPSPLDLGLIEARLEPRTLHRLLAWSPGASRFRHHEGNPLAEEVVIVDEASMIDLSMMERLLRALRPEARLILLGDAEQLPSVDAGAVLRDLVPEAGVVREGGRGNANEGETPSRAMGAREGGSAPVDRRWAFSSRLTQSYRMDPRDPAGRNILSVAGAINEGRIEGLFAGEEPIRPCPTVEDLAFEKVELLPAGNPAQLEAFLERWSSERIGGLPNFGALVRREFSWRGGAFVPEDEEALRTLFAHFESLRILCITRGASTRTGVDAINEVLHRKAAQALGGLREGSFLPGEPVMMQRNDYERGLFNGDQGLILRVREDQGPGHHFRAVFLTTDGFSIFHLDGLRAQLRHSYAMTVHKAQGSEFDAVALILPENPLPLLSRELLYTAVTRSRRSVAIVGSREVLEAGVRQRLERHSGIGARLR